MESRNSSPVCGRWCVVDGVAPREALPRQAPAPRVLPLHIRRQPVTGYRGLDNIVNFPCFVHGAANRVHRRAPFLLTAGVAPLHRVVPVDGVHGIVRGLAGTDVGKGVAVIRDSVCCCIARLLAGANAPRMRWFNSSWGLESSARSGFVHSVRQSCQMTGVEPTDAAHVGQCRSGCG